VIATTVGVQLGQAFVIEGDASHRLPQGIGEAFFATPKAHPATTAIVRGDEDVALLPLFVGAQSLSATSDANAVPLLTSSSDSIALESIGALQNSGGELDATDAKATGPFYVAMAHQLRQTPKESANPAARAIVIGATNLAWSRSWQDPALLGTRLFMENALAWLAERPSLVSVPAAAPKAAGVSLTEASLSELWRYVLLYMPGAAALCGVFVMLRRRSKSPAPSTTRKADAAGGVKS
jgi:hypothetical protein